MQFERTCLLGASDPKILRLVQIESKFSIVEEWHIAAFSVVNYSLKLYERSCLKSLGALFPHRGRVRVLFFDIWYGGVVNWSKF